MIPPQDAITYVVVTYNSASVISDCLKSIMRQTLPRQEIILVDNRSVDQTVNLVRSTFPDVKIIENMRNEGYGIANNQGVAEATADVVAIVNPDVQLDPDWAREISLALARRSSRAACEGKLLLARDPSMLNCAGSTINLWGFGCATGFGEPDVDGNEAHRVSYASGAAFAIRRAVFKEIGGFDPTYFMYHEDVDLGLRIWSSGWEVVYVPSARATHALNEAWRAEKTFLLEKNRWKTLVKNMPPAYFWRSGLAHLVFEIGLFTYLMRTGLVAPKARAVIDFVRELPKVLAYRRAGHGRRLKYTMLSSLISSYFPNMLPRKSIAIPIAKRLQDHYLKSFFRSE